MNDTEHFLFTDGLLVEKLGTDIIKIFNKWRRMRLVGDR